MKEYIVQAYAQETIDSFDAHNAPELVRCKDCKWANIANKEEPVIYECACPYHQLDSAVYGNWFCADRKRR